MGNRAYIQGNEGGQLLLAKGEDQSLNVIFMDANGAAYNLTGHTFSLEVYADSQRSAAAVASHAGTLGGTLTDGRGVITIANSAMSYGPGTYWAFIKLNTTTGALVEIIDRMFVAVVG